MKDKDLHELLVEIEGHNFDYKEWDTGVGKCRHPSHGGWYSSTCWKAEAAEFFKEKEAKRAGADDRITEITRADLQRVLGRDNVDFEWELLVSYWARMCPELEVKNEQDQG